MAQEIRTCSYDAVGKLTRHVDFNGIKGEMHLFIPPIQREQKIVQKISGNKMCVSP